MFCAYKEVLGLYRQGLKVPDDVTIVWPDDNFGYVRNFANAEEQQRRGGFGVYYHISYLGAPLSYLWLETTPPALIWEEMSKAYEHGARKIWIVNVGDLKPGEIATEFFLQMAWDINRWRRNNLPDYLRSWAARDFGTTDVEEIAALMDGYYRLNFARKPEHLQWWLPGQPPRPSRLDSAETDTRQAAFDRLRRYAGIIAQAMPVAKREAFEELVNYPVQAAALANTRYFAGEAGDKENALAADGELKELTRRYNEQLAGGKWNRLMTLEPADNQWKSMRLAPWAVPEFPAEPKVEKPTVIAIPAERFVANRADANGVGWEKIPGLGRTGDAIAILPTTATPVDEARFSTDAARLGYEVDFPSAGDFTLTSYLLPTHPLVPGRGLRFAVGIDDAPPQLVVCEVPDGSPDWAQGVLNNSVSVTTKVSVAKAGRHILRVYGVDAGVVLERFTLGRDR